MHMTNMIVNNGLLKLKNMDESTNWIVKQKKLNILNFIPSCL